MKKGGAYMRRLFSSITIIFRIVQTFTKIILANQEDQSRASSQG